MEGWRGTGRSMLYTRFGCACQALNLRTQFSCTYMYGNFISCSLWSVRNIHVGLVLKNIISRCLMGRLSARTQEGRDCL